MFDVDQMVTWIDKRGLQRFGRVQKVGRKWVTVSQKSFWDRRNLEMKVPLADVKAWPPRKEKPDGS